MVSHSFSLFIHSPSDSGAEIAPKAAFEIGMTHFEGVTSFHRMIKHLLILCGTIASRGLGRLTDLLYETVRMVILTWMPLFVCLSLTPTVIYQGELQTQNLISIQELDQHLGRARLEKPCEKPLATPQRFQLNEAAAQWYTRSVLLRGVRTVLFGAGRHQHKSAPGGKSEPHCRCSRRLKVYRSFSCCLWTLMLTLRLSPNPVALRLYCSSFCL